MTGICKDRIAIVTGAGHGIGRAHALALAAEGARVIVNDMGGARDGSGSSAAPAQAVVEEIIAKGGEALASTEDVSNWEGAKRLVACAVDHFGGLQVVVNNAGILRDKMLVNMSESEWDAVVAVHLKGSFAVLRHAAAFWREQSKSGASVDARVVNTTSPSGLFGNAGQTNYGAAKAGVAALTLIAAQELMRYGVTVNAIAPTAMTRMTEDLPSMQAIQAKSNELGFDELAPENISPLVVWLASSGSREVTGRVFSVWGGRVSVVEGWVNGPTVERGGRWDPNELAEVIPGLVAQAAANADMRGQR